MDSQATPESDLWTLAASYGMTGLEEFSKMLCSRPGVWETKHLAASFSMCVRFEVQRSAVLVGGQTREADKGIDGFVVPGKKSGA